MKPTLNMMIGVPGSGKSTARNVLIEQARKYRIDYVEGIDYFVLSTDDFIEVYAAVVGKSYSEVFEESIGLAEKNLQVWLQKAVELGADIYWDQTNLSIKTRAKKLARIPDTYHKNAFVIERTDEELDAQLKKRLDGGGKWISPNVITDMKKSYEKPSCAEGFDIVFFLSSTQQHLELKK